MSSHRAREDRDQLHFQIARRTGVMVVATRTYGAVFAPTKAGEMQHEGKAWQAYYGHDDF